MPLYFRTAAVQFSPIFPLTVTFIFLLLVKNIKSTDCPILFCLFTWIVAPFPLFLISQRSSGFVPQCPH